MLPRHSVRRVCQLCRPLEPRRAIARPDIRSPTLHPRQRLPHDFDAPVLLRELDDLLIAQELNEKVFSGKLKSELVRLALSCPLPHHRLIKNTYERLEFLGDTLLKLVTSVDVCLRRSPGQIPHESLSQAREKLVNNRSLMASGVKAGIVPYIRGAPIRRSEWIPTGWTYDDKSYEEAEAGGGSQKLSYKVGLVTLLRVS